MDPGLFRGVFVFLRFVSLSALSVLLLCPGCVRYQPQHAHIESAAVAATRTSVPAGPLPFEDAVRLLVDRHPVLRATRADIAAVNTCPGPRPLVGSTMVLDGNPTETMIGTDVLALLGIGPRKAEKALARAVRSEAVSRHHERARDLVAELAEAYAVHRVLMGLQPPTFPVDIDAFESAGLASKADIAAARAVVAEVAAESRILEVQRQDAQRAIVRLIAAVPGTAITPVPVDGTWPALEEPERRRLVLARGDLQRLLAAWHVADKNYRFQIARQYPNLFVGLGSNVNLQVPMQLFAVSLPLDAPAEARAAEHARSAAFHRLDAGVLDALHDAEAARLDLEAANALLAGRVERRDGALALIESERAHLETDPSGLTRVVFVSGRYVDAVRQHREAAVAAARARVEAARAAGWPTPQMVGESR